jgi:ubiquinol-cytochrome c reductase cytochrome c subunit
MAALACTGLALAITAAAQSLTPVEEGRRAYLSNNCYSCHGDVGGGSAYGAPAFRREGAELGDLTEAIREGEDRGMPSFPKLTTTDINNIYAYLHSLGSSIEPTFYLWWEPIPTARVQPRTLDLYASARQKRLRLWMQ